jgi:hypothetical protein
MKRREFFAAMIGFLGVAGAKSKPELAAPIAATALSSSADEIAFRIPFIFYRGGAYGRYGPSPSASKLNTAEMAPRLKWIHSDLPAFISEQMASGIGGAA